MDQAKPKTDLSWDAIRRCRAAKPEHVVHRALPHETVVLNVTTSTYHALDAVGAQFYEVVLAAASLEAASTELAAEFDQPLERVTADLTTFCADLLDRDLIELQSVAGR